MWNTVPRTQGSAPGTMAFYWIAIDLDRREVYAVGDSDTDIVVFLRDPSTGALSWHETRSFPSRAKRDAFMQAQLWGWVIEERTPDSYCLAFRARDGTAKTIYRIWGMQGRER